MTTATDLIIQRINDAARSGTAPSATIKPPFLGIFSIASEQVYSSC